MGGGGGAGDHSGSLFRVGDNVELTRVIGMVSVLVVFVMILERFIHSLEHKLHKYPKYHEMMTKVFGELMILGLIGLGIKILKELGKLDAYSKPMIAFQAADLTIFIVAIALILQAIVVFLRLRRKNIQADKAELLSTQHLVDHIARTNLPAWYHEFAALFTYARHQNLKELTRADIPEVVQLRILRHKFLKSYGLPQLFPFSKYLRQAQDNQISHMIEVEISTWMVLLLIAWGMEAVSKIVDHRYHTTYAIVVSFVIFSWLSVLLHIAITSYLTWAIDSLVNAAVDAPSSDPDRRYQYLNEIAEFEMQAADRELASDAIAIMEHVREHEQMKHVKRKRNMLSEHDTGFQLVGTIFRNLCGSTKCHTEDANQTQEEGIKSAHGGIDNEPAPVQGPKIELRWFSRKAWHFIIMSTLMLNALYVALFCQCVLFKMSEIYHQYGAGIMCMLPLPLLINVFIFQPRILRNFILVSSIFRVDDTALGDVIDHFTETVQLRAGFVETVHAYLNATNQTIADVQNELEARDVAKTGYLDAEQVRLVLRRFGFQLSYFRFNSVAKLLFDFQGIKIEYAQVTWLLEIGQSEDVRALANATAFLGESGSIDSYTTMSPFISSASFQTPPLESVKTGSKRALLRTKSSTASSLYRMYVDEPLSLSRPDQAPLTPNDDSTSSQYLRI